eukprot:260565_1
MDDFSFWMQIAFFFILIASNQIQTLQSTDNNNLLCNESLWSTNNNGNWTYSDTECAYTSSNEYEGTILWLGDNYKQSLQWSNYRITVFVKIVEGYETGILFRTHDASTWLGQGTKYALLVHDCNVFLFKTPYVILHSHTMNANYCLNETRNITVDIMDNRFTVFVDSQFIFEYIDNCFPVYYDGSIGFRSYLSTSTFSFFKIDLNPTYLIPQKYHKLSELQQNALVDIYKSTNGDYWHQSWNLSNVMTNEACYMLCGITCANNYNQSIVASLSLNTNNLSGTIPGNLKHLTSLINIDLSNNYLYGEIPDIFHHLPTINSIGLRSNQLTSTLPISFRYANKLTFLELSNNNLFGSMNVLTNCSLLTFLFCDNNNFSGEIPNEFCNFTALGMLSIQNNTNMLGTIPSCIGNLKNLKTLRITRNGI